ncbi:mobilization protein MobD-like protein (plasmid) [Chondrocystis sp. NIES-4102]|nr:mobilization protein MobD-like protein [Chondrocystis sp. NIES-4102]
MPTIHLIDGEKGGVGKSFVAKTMVQYAIDRKFPYVAVETDRSNPDVANIYGDICKRAVLSEDEKQAHKADRIFELALSNPLIVSLPSQVHKSLRNWIEKNKLLEISPQYGIKFQKWFVSNGEFDSIKLFVKSANFYREKIPHVLVRNFGLCDEWGQVNDDHQVQEVIKKYNVKVIDFPKLEHNERYIINKEQLTFEKARENDQLTILGKQRVVNFLNSAYAAFDSTESW